MAVVECHAPSQASTWTAEIKAVSQLMQATYHAIISFVDQDGITELKVQ